MLPRFSKVQMQTESGTSVLLTVSWGTLELGIKTLSRKSRESDFEDALYPHQGLRNLVAIVFMVLVHIVVIYSLFFNKTDHALNSVKSGEERGQLIFFDMLAKNDGGSKPKPVKKQVEKKLQQRQSPRSRAVIKAPGSVIASPSTRSPVAAPRDDTLRRITAARERRRAMENDAVREQSLAQSASNGASADDLAMARIKANIQAANYNRKGTNGIFQVLSKGVQTGRFSFRGWTNDPHESTRQTFEVDAGVGGNVELALIKRMIELIREHYSGDFNWDSQRQGRVVVLSARPADSASLERFMMKEFFGS